MNDTDLRSDVLDRLSQNRTFSDERRKYLERLGTLTAGSKIRVKFTQMPTASCAWRENLGYHEIRIRQEAVDPSYLGKIGDKLGKNMVNTLMQEGLLYHELGHVLMSDYDAWENTCSKGTSLKKNEMFKQWLNCTEDVVIEAWLREKYDCGKILDLKNEVKAFAIPQIKKTEAAAHSAYHDRMFQDGSINKFSFALSMIESLGRFDGYFLDWAESVAKPKFESLKEPITEMISEAVKEPDAQKRYALIRDTFDELFQDNFSQESEDPKQSKENQGGGDQEMQIEMIPSPDGDDEGEDGEEDGDGEDGGGDDSGNNQGDQDTNGGSGSNIKRDPRPVEEILGERSPDEVMVVR